jgi:hypothetical protein
MESFPRMALRITREFVGNRRQLAGDYHKAFRAIDAEGIWA